MTDNFDLKFVHPEYDIRHMTYDIVKIIYNQYLKHSNLTL